MRKSIMLGALAASGLLLASDAAAAGEVEPKIIGGHQPRETPSWMAALTFDAPDHGASDVFTCGGALVFRSWVVTAAHCVTERPTSKSAARFADERSTGIPIGERDYEVRVGSADRTTGGHTARVTDVIAHPDWSWGRGEPQAMSDVALLRLDRAVPVQPIPLGGRHTWPGTPVRYYGWGVDQPGGRTLPTQMQEIRTRVTLPSQCSSSGPSITHREICIDNPHGTDGTCTGDSGGPIVRESRGVTRLVGTISRGSTRACGQGPDIATATPEYRQFIYRTVRGASRR